MSLVLSHEAGFFSCCSIRLWHILQYVKETQQLPTHIDSTRLFTWYKKPSDNRDITFDYFVHHDIMPPVSTDPVAYHWDDQYEPYPSLPYQALCPMVQKYFTPNRAIDTLLHEMECKYRIQYSMTCVLFYRGNDKNRETTICGYEEYINRANDIQKLQPNVRFLIQSDETEFIDFFTQLYPNSLVLRDEIRHIPKCNSTVDNYNRHLNYDFSKQFLAITLLMSKCKYIVCGSGNCSIWIMFYRGHANNVCQQLNNTWIMN